MLDLDGLRNHRRPSRLRWLILDVDGTIRDRSGTISDAVKEAIWTAQRAGVRVSIATGRRFPSALPIVEGLGITGPLICYQGAMVRDPATGTTLFHQPIDLVDARSVVVFARGLRLEVTVHVDDVTYTDRIVEDSPGYLVYQNSRAVAVGDVLQWLDRPPTTISIVSDRERTREITRRARAAFESRLYVSTGHPLLVDVSHRDVSKAAAVRAIAEREEIPRGAIAAIGDDWNDIELLRYAGVGIAMGNADPEVKRAADLVAPSIVDDGAAVVIRELLEEHNGLRWY